MQLSTDLPVRGECGHPGCLADPSPCATFLVVANGVPRMFAIDPHEVCSACEHEWIAHRITAAEHATLPQLYRRGGTPSGLCGGFCSLSDPSTWTFRTVCACGAALLAHHMNLDGAQGNSGLTGPVTVAPPQFATTHPPLSSPPGLPVPGSAYPSPAAIASAPPIFAYSGLRQPEPGVTNDRRMASAERARKAKSSSASNTPRIRPGPAPASSSSSNLSLPVAGVPSSVSSLSTDEVGMQTFTVSLHVYQHPHLRPRHGSYPHTGFLWTVAQHNDIVESLVAFDLVFTVTLPLEGPVWQALGDQVREHCSRKQIEFPGYDWSVTPATPTQLPFALLLCLSKRNQVVKHHNVSDDLDANTFTVGELLKGGYTTPSFPLGGDFARFPMLRLVPRHGDLSSHMLRLHVHTSGHRGMHDYPDVQAPRRMHPCFPARVMCVLGAPFGPGCIEECPRDPVAIPTSPVAPEYDDLYGSPPRLTAAELEALADEIPSCPGSPMDVWRLPEAGPSHSRASIADNSRSNAPSTVLAIGPVRPSVAPTVASPDGQPVTEPTSPAHHALPAPEHPLTPPLNQLATPTETSRTAHAGFSSASSALGLVSVDTGAAGAAGVEPGLPSPLALSAVPPWGAARVPLFAPSPPLSTSPALPPMSLTAPEPVSEPPVSVAVASPAADAVRAPPPPPTVRYGGRRSARMSTGGRPPRRGGSASANQSSRGVRTQRPDSDTTNVTDVASDAHQPGPSTVEHADGHAQTLEPPTNRRRLHGPQEVDLGARAVTIPVPPGRPLGRVSAGRVGRWIRRVMEALNTADHSTTPIPRIRAPNLEVAAQILIFEVEWLFEHEGVALSHALAASFREAFEQRFPGRGPICVLAPLPAIMSHANIFDLQVGEAIGGSPMRSLVRHIIHVITSDQRFWQRQGRYAIPRWGPSGVEGRQRAFKVAGFFALLHMVVLGTGPDPISPFLLRYAIEGVDSACRLDPAFMRLIDADLFMRLVPWVEYEWGTPFPADPSHPLHALIFAAGQDAMVFSNPPLPGELRWMERLLVSSAVLGVPEVSAQGDIAGFINGLHAALGPGSTLSQTFHGRCRDYLAFMCNQRLDDVATLLAHLEFRSGLDREAIATRAAHSEDMIPESYDPILEDMAIDALKLYLKGQGHPDHQDVRAVVGSEVFERDREDPFLRARLFLHLMSGSDLVPMETEWKLKIFIRHKGDRAVVEAGEVVPDPAPLEVHSCFYDCTLTIDEGVRNLLREGHPFLSFQAWIHGAVLAPEDYNNI